MKGLEGKIQCKSNIMVKLLNKGCILNRVRLRIVSLLQSVYFAVHGGIVSIKKLTYVLKKKSISEAECKAFVGKIRFLFA